jgi:ABC-type Fe3+-citrate transport system substrate-binding protein
MHMIRIDDEVWQRLKSKGEVFEDTPNDVLRRILELEPVNIRNGSSRLRRGEKTPNSAYRGPILRALGELGGSAKASIILSRVEELMSKQLNELDRQTTANNQARWSNTAQWERVRMVKDGLIQKKAHGIWELTKRGKEEAELHAPVVKKEKLR